jgi:hypothetical protein
VTALSIFETKFVEHTPNTSIISVISKVTKSAVTAVTGPHFRSTEGQKHQFALCITIF